MVIFLRVTTGSQPMGGVNRTPTQAACTDAHSVSQHILNRLTTFHHAWLKSWKAQDYTSLFPEHLSSTCHVSFLAAPDSDHEQKFSHPFHPLLPSFRQPHQHTQALWFTINVYPAKFHGRVADQHKSHLLQKMHGKPTREETFFRRGISSNSSGPAHWASASSAADTTTSAANQRS